MKDGVIVLDCKISVNSPGNYKIKGTLSVEKPFYTGYDEVIMESSSKIHKLNDNSDFAVYFDHRHVSENKEMNSVPNGPYTVELFLTPAEKNISRKVNPYVFSGYTNNIGFPNYAQKSFLKTKYYPGSIFENLPLMRSSFGIKEIDEGSIYVVN